MMPFLVGTSAVWVASRLLARPTGWWVGTWWLGLVVVAQIVVLACNRLVVRLLPISMLLRMSLAFPDKAPSRVGTALRSGNIEKLRRSLQDTAADASDGAADGAPTDLDDAIVEALALVRALSVYDRGTRGHSERVRAYSEVLGEELGMNADERERLRWGAILHDVGKLTVPAPILNSSGRPTEAEWAVLRNHPPRVVGSLPRSPTGSETPCMPPISTMNDGTEVATRTVYAAPRFPLPGASWRWQTRLL